MIKHFYLWILYLLDRASSYKLNKLDQLDVTLWKFFIAQHVSNAITFILRSWWLSVGVLLCFGVHYCAPTCIRIPPYSSRTAPIHQYTPKQNNTPTDSHQLLRMNVIAFETCWAIKTFIKWHQVGSIYSTNTLDMYAVSRPVIVKCKLFQAQ